DRRGRLRAPGTQLNFHYTRTSTQPIMVETMTVDVPNAQPNSGFRLCLKFIDGIPPVSYTCYGNSFTSVAVNPSCQHREYAALVLLHDAIGRVRRTSRQGAADRGEYR